MQKPNSLWFSKLPQRNAEILYQTEQSDPFKVCRVADILVNEAKQINNLVNQ